MKKSRNALNGLNTVTKGLSDLLLFALQGVIKMPQSNKIVRIVLVYADKTKSVIRISPPLPKQTLVVFENENGLVLKKSPLCKEFF